LTPNPILKVLSELNESRVRYLLMGGQACVLYGGAEFSRDTDIVILAEADNLDRLTAALDQLQASRIAVPPFEMDFLLRGHAVHFRCRHPAALGQRIDVMSVLRGVAPFTDLWQRRTTVEYDDRTLIELLSLPDLVAAKKTQRDKDWPMLRRLVDAHYFAHRDGAQPDQIAFWLRESRSPAILRELVSMYVQIAKSMANERPALVFAIADNEAGVAAALAREEDAVREADRAYWLPLKAELERLRRRD
jgi:hypothetical protein